MTKRCSKCKEEKPLDQFNFKDKARGQVQSRCRDCHNAYLKIHYGRNKAKYILKARLFAKKKRIEFGKIVTQLKCNPCTDCGKQYPPYVMDFDHINAEDKLDDIAALLRRGYGKQTLIDEIAKCELVCSNCHRIRTHNRKINAGDYFFCVQGAFR